MKFLDKIAMNRLIQIIGNLLLSLIKILDKYIAPKTIEKTKEDKNEKKNRFPWIKKKIKEITNDS